MPDSRKRTLTKSYSALTQIYFVLGTYRSISLPDRETLLRIRSAGVCPAPDPERDSTYTVICFVTPDGGWGEALAGWPGHLYDVNRSVWWWDGIIPWTAVTTSFVATTGSSQSWSVPSDWNSSSNTVEGIGCGGSGFHSGGGAGGGGAGAYAIAHNVSLTPSGTATYNIGTAGNNVDTMFVSTSILVAKAGTTATSATGGAGGAAASCIPTTGAFSGGSGATDPNSQCGGGGGGAAGPGGAGKGGGSTSSGGAGGGGGGANGGTSSAGSAGSSSTGGNGGNGSGGSGHGNGSTTTGGAATAATGGGGGGGGGGGSPSTGGAGATGVASWTQTVGGQTAGAGGGGGGSGNGGAGSLGGVGGLYGGGGGGGIGSSNAVGAQGIIVATYTPGGSSFSSVLSASSSQSTSFAERGAFFRALVASNPQTVTRRLLSSNTKSASSSQTGSVVATGLHARLLGAGSALTSGLRRLAGASRSATDGQTPSLFRGIGAARRSTSAQVFGLTNKIGKSNFGVSSAEVAAIANMKALAAAFSAINTQAPALDNLISIIRLAAIAQAVAVRRSLGLLRSAVSPEATARVVSASVVRRASDAMTSARTLLVSVRRAALDPGAVSLAQAPVRFKILSVASAQTASLVALFVHAGINTGLALATFEAQAATVARSIGLLRTAATSQVAALARLASAFRAFSTTTTQAGGLLRLTGAIRKAVNAQAITRRVLVSAIRGAVSAESTARASSLSVARSVVSTQVASLKRTSNIVRAIGFSQVSLLIRIVSIARASMSTQTAAIVATHLGFTNPLSLFAFGAQVVALRRTVNVLRSVLGVQAFSAVRLISALRPTASPEFTARTLAVFKRFATTSGEAVAILPLRAFQRACSAVSSEVAALFRVSLHTMPALAVAAPGSARLVKLVSALRRAAGAMVAARGAITIGLHLPADPLQVVGLGLIIGHTRAFLAQQAQTLFASAAFHHFGNFAVSAQTVSAGAVALARSLARAFRVASSSRAGAASWYFRFVPLAQRRRVVRLPEPQQFAALPPSARRVVLPEAQLMVMLPPAERRVVVPLETDDMSDYEIRFPEPAFFSPLDPTDTDLFTFDWSIRGYPNDTIVFASVVSIPSGVNFLGPAFVSGPSVTVTIGPFAIVPPLPATYSLRCMAMFGSGRISNYSVPFIVKAL